MNGSAFLDVVISRYRELQQQCDRAIAQVPRERWADRLDPESNSLVTLMLHISGNLLSRWSDFLASDGEKPDRDRDSEFEDAPSQSPEAILERWTKGWKCLFDSLSALTEADLERTVTIRSQPHTVVEAIQRNLTHTAGHAGQIVFLAKHLAGPGWQTLSIPRGRSAEFRPATKKRAPEA